MAAKEPRGRGGGAFAPCKSTVPLSPKAHLCSLSFARGWKKRKMKVTSPHQANRSWPAWLTDPIHGNSFPVSWQPCTAVCTLLPPQTYPLPFFSLDQIRFQDPCWWWHYAWAQIKAAMIAGKTWDGEFKAGSSQQGIEFSRAKNAGLQRASVQEFGSEVKWSSELKEWMNGWTDRLDVCILYACLLQTWMMMMMALKNAWRTVRFASIIPSHCFKRKIRSEAKQSKLQPPERARKLGHQEFFRDV